MPSPSRIDRMRVIAGFFQEDSVLARGVRPTSADALEEMFKLMIEELVSLRIESFQDKRDIEPYRTFYRIAEAQQVIIDGFVFKNRNGRGGQLSEKLRRAIDAELGKKKS